MYQSENFMFNTKILTNRCIAKREMIHFKSLQFNWTEISQSLLGGPICNRTGSGGCVLPAPPTFFFETQQTLTKKKGFSDCLRLWRRRKSLCHLSFPKTSHGRSRILPVLPIQRIVLLSLVRWLLGDQFQKVCKGGKNTSKKVHYSRNIVAGATGRRENCTCRLAFRPGLKEKTSASVAGIIKVQCLPYFLFPMTAGVNFL